MWKPTVLCYENTFLEPMTWVNFISLTTQGDVKFIVDFEYNYLAMRGGDQPSVKKLIVIGGASKQNIVTRLLAMEHHDQVEYVGYNSDGDRIYFYDNISGFRIDNKAVSIWESVYDMAWDLLTYGHKVKIAIIGSKKYPIFIGPKIWYPLIWIATDGGNNWSKSPYRAFIQGLTELFYSDIDYISSKVSDDLSYDEFTSQYALVKNIALGEKANASNNLSNQKFVQ